MLRRQGKRLLKEQKENSTANTGTVFVSRKVNVNRRSNNADLDNDHSSHNPNHSNSSSLRKPGNLANVVATDTLRDEIKFKVSRAKLHPLIRKLKFNSLPRPCNLSPKGLKAEKLLCSAIAREDKINVNSRVAKDLASTGRVTVSISKGGTGTDGAKVKQEVKVVVREDAFNTADIE